MWMAWKNRLEAVALALVVVLSLSACRGEAGVKATPSAEVTAETTGKPTVAPTAAPTPELTVEAAARQPSAPPVELREYTLTEIALPKGWYPTADSNNVAAGWVVLARTESGRVVEQAIYRAADGVILALDGYSVYGGEGVMSRGTATRALVLRSDPQREGESLWNYFDVEEGRLLLDTPVADGDEGFGDKFDPISSPDKTWPQPKEDKASGLWGYVDEAGNWVLPAQYYSHSTPFEDGMAVVCLTDYTANGSYYNAIDVTGKELLPRRYLTLFYLGDGMFNYWGENGEGDCGLVSIDGVETPTGAFSNWFNGGLTANYGLIAQGFTNGDSFDYTYFDYAGNQVSEPFTWAGPIGDDGAGFVSKDGKLFRIQF